MLFVLASISPSFEVMLFVLASMFVALVPMSVSLVPIAVALVPIEPKFSFTAATKLLLSVVFRFAMVPIAVWLVPMSVALLPTKIPWSLIAVALVHYVCCVIA